MNRCFAFCTNEYHNKFKDVLYQAEYIHDCFVGIMLNKNDSSRACQAFVKRLRETRALFVFTGGKVVQSPTLKMRIKINWEKTDQAALTDHGYTYGATTISPAEDD